MQDNVAVAWSLWMNSHQFREYKRRKEEKRKEKKKRRKKKEERTGIIVTGNAEAAGCVVCVLGGDSVGERRAWRGWIAPIACRLRLPDRSGLAIKRGCRALRVAVRAGGRLEVDTVVKQMSPSGGCCRQVVEMMDAALASKLSQTGSVGAEVAAVQARLLEEPADAVAPGVGVGAQAV